MMYLYIVMGVYNTWTIYLMIEYIITKGNGHRKNYVAYFGKLDHVTQIR
jgi:hypothetical protein